MSASPSVGGKSWRCSAPTELEKQAGAIWCGGEDVTREAPHVRARRGLCLIPDGRGIFRNLSVRDNIRLQARPGDHKQAIEHAVETFPVLKHRLGELAGRLSGGQQQMLALTRAYVTSPSVVLLDEVSMGLAPKAIDLIFDSLRKLSATGMSMLLVEQYVERALEVAHRVAVLDRGVISLEEARDKIASADIAKQYFAT
jgi:branched-chain amino acid transport system ATP-binding protein